MKAGSSTGFWLGLAGRAAGLWRALGGRRHAMGFSSLRELSVDADGSLVSTGFHPEAELVSDRPQPPRQWCWVSFTLAAEAEAAGLARLLVHGPGSPEPERILLGPPSRGALPALIRLPDGVSRIALVPSNHPGRTNLRGVRITEVGKLGLLLSLVLEDLPAAWRLHRAAPSFAYFKTKLIEARQARQLPADGPDWLPIYASGAHPTGLSFDGATTFAIVVDADGCSAPSLDAALASVAAQTYPRWRLMVDGPADPACMAVLRRWMARSPAITLLDGTPGGSASSRIGKDGADYVVFLDADDILEPHALARFAAAASRQDADMLYGDGLLIEGDGSGYVALNALPAFSYESYLRSPGQIHPIVLRASLALPTGGLDRSAPTREAAVVLQALERRLRIVHIPDILCRRRPSARAASQAAAGEIAVLQTAHLRRLGFAEAEATPADAAGAFRIGRHPRHDGRVLAVVPTKDRLALLETCIASVRATTRPGQVDIVVVDHESTEADTLAYLDRLARTGARVLRQRGPFNYSALNNAAVAQFGAGYGFHLFLNNDIEAETEGWLDAMLDLALQPDVGVVGATLLYPDRRIQHAGVVVGMAGTAEHAYRFARLDDYLQLRQGPHLTRQYSAVTGACMLVNGAAFAAVGGFDETLAVGFNDIDLCLRIGAEGRRILQCAEAVLLHHESASRGKSLNGRDPHPDDTRLFQGRYARLLAEGDPFFSPLLDPTDALFVPRPLIVRESQPGLRTVVHEPSSRRSEGLSGSS